MEPKGWTSHTLEDLSTKPISYGIVQTGDPVKNGVKCLRVVDITKRSVDLPELITTSEKISQSYKRTLLEENEIVLALRGEIGMCLLVSSELVGCNLTRGLARISPNEKVLPKFLFQLLSSPHKSREFELRSNGSALQEISIGELRQVSVCLPPLPEQQKIAAILSTWDRAIELTEKLIAAKQKRNQALMQQLLTGKVRFKEFEGKPWKNTTLSTLGSFHKGKGIAKGDLTECGLPAILYGELYTTHDIVVRGVTSFVPEGIASNSLAIQHGDILFPCSGETADEIAKPSVYLSHSEAFAGGDIIAFRPKTGDPLFLAYALNSKNAFSYRSSVAQGQSVVHIYTKNLEPHPIPFPSIQEQQRIAVVLEVAQSEILMLRRKVHYLMDQKKGLMQQLLTGKVRVKVDSRATKEASP